MTTCSMQLAPPGTQGATGCNQTGSHFQDAYFSSLYFLLYGSHSMLTPKESLEAAVRWAYAGAGVVAGVGVGIYNAAPKLTSIPLNGASEKVISTWNHQISTRGAQGIASPMPPSPETGATLPRRLLLSRQSRAQLRWRPLLWRRSLPLSPSLRW